MPHLYIITSDLSPSAMYRNATLTTVPDRFVYLLISWIKMFTQKSHVITRPFFRDEKHFFRRKTTPVRYKKGEKKIICHQWHPKHLPLENMWVGLRPSVVTKRVREWVVDYAVSATEASFTARTCLLRQATILLKTWCVIRTVSWDKRDGLG